MLHELCHLAQRESLVEDTAFDVRPIAWTIDLRANGDFIAFSSNRYQVEVAPAKSSSAKPKIKEEIKRFTVPRQFNPETGGTRTSGAYAYFLVDKSDYVLGCALDAKAGAIPTDKKLHHQLFIDKVEECWAATQEPALKAILTFLKAVHQDGLPADLPAKSSPGDLFAFVVRPSLDEFAHDLDSVKAFWRKKCAPPEIEDTGRHCLITGKAIGEGMLFPQIKRVPGAQASSGLVSFEMQASRSYGWGKAENAPVSSEAAQAAAMAMNRLLDQAFQKQDGTVLPRRNYQISEDTVACYWARDAFGDETADQLAGTLRRDQGGKAGEIWHAPKRGKAPAPDFDATKFYAVTLTGAQGRTIVRDWYETTVGRVRASVDLHFKQLNLLPNTFPAKGRDLPSHYGMELLKQSLTKSGKANDLDSTFAIGLFAAAINSQLKYPFPLLAMALDRARSDASKDEWIDSHRRDARTALIKAILIRNYSMELKPDQDESNTDPAYLTGQLFACIERMQYLALGDQVNATVRDRYFAAASITPRAVMKTLIQDLNGHYAKKAKRRKPGQCVNLLREISVILKAFSASMDPHEGFPARFSAREQGLFMVGYHVQRHEYLKKREGEPVDAPAGEEAAAQ